MTPRDLASYLLWQAYCALAPGWKDEFLPPVLSPDPEEGEPAYILRATMSLYDKLLQ